MDLIPANASALASPTEQILTVTQLTRQVKSALEACVGAVWVQGEISNHRRQTSGHHYFTLKDAGAQLSCVLFKGSAQFVRAPLADGLLIQAFGEITVYEARGQYQMLVKKVQAAGQGALQTRFEEMKRRLAAEGLFDSERKRRIPPFPRTIAVVTSPTGAALQDMLNILTRRAAYLRILVAPVRVQGAGAEHEIAAAVRMLNEESGRGLPVIDTIVVARGGGSLEDLWCFNEEVVARAIFEGDIPVISAVGHEIDFTISDFTADLRAPTPSAAAELVAPDGNELSGALIRQLARLERRAYQAVETGMRFTEMAGRGILQKDAERLLLPWRQRLDLASETLENAVTDAVAVRAAPVEDFQSRLATVRPQHLLAERAGRLEVTKERLMARIAALLERHRTGLSAQEGLLRTLGPEATLERGFSCTLDAGGRIVREASQLQPGETFETRFRRGRVRGIVQEVRED